MSGNTPGEPEGICLLEFKEDNFGIRSQPHGGPQVPAPLEVKTIILPMWLKP